MTDEPALLTTSDAARILDVTPATVRLMQRRGELPATTKTVSGVHLYRRVDVEHLAATRTARRVNGGR
jgi:DNA-binding transcriptional MerR regulator